MILISIIIPHAPGRKRLLWRCLHSLLTSSYKNFEVIVVDNSGNPDLVDKAIRLSSKIRIIRMTKNSGIFAFNVGYANATGHYILSLDDDSFVRKDTLQKIIKVLKKVPANFGVIALNVVDPLSDRLTNTQSQDLTLKQVNNFQSGGAILKPDVFKKIGYFDQDFFCWYHENDFSIRLKEEGCQIYFAKEIIIYHRKDIARLRPNLLYLTARNKAWFNIKHFSFIFFIFLIPRDFLWVFLTPLRRKSLKALFYSLVGYIMGYLTLLTPIKKRHVVSFKTQIDFIKSYLFH
jgi:GT2 family glycosyltransferase